MYCLTGGLNVKKDSWRWNIQDVERLIAAEEKESAYLDYKESVALGSSDRCKEKISKNVSAFANAGGGTLVYGVREDGHIPIEIDEGSDPNTISKEWLEQVIDSRIHRKIEDVRINQIPIESERGNRVLYVVHVPQSMRAPHQASDMRFYTRRNFRSEPMEEYEIRDSYMREEAPDVTLDMFFRRFGARIDGFRLSLVNPETLHNLEINGVLRNEGGGLVEYAAVALWFDARLISEESRKDPAFRPLKIRFEETEEREVDVFRLDINWGGPSKMPLFKTVEYRLLEKDLPIHFKAPWLEEADAPFVLWDAKAPRMEPAHGFLRFRIEDDTAVLKSEEVPVLSEVTQDGRNREILKTPDLSLDSSFQ